MINDAERNTATASPTVADGAGKLGQKPTTRRKSQPTARAPPGAITILERNGVSENVVVDIADESGDDSEKEQFEVEKILETKMEDGVQVFRVRWKDFGAKDDTWEPRKALEEGASELLKAFLEAEQEKENASTARRGRPSTKRTSGGPSQAKIPSTSVPTAKRSRTAAQKRTSIDEVAEMQRDGSLASKNIQENNLSAAVPTAKRASATPVQANTTNEEAMELVSNLFTATLSQASGPPAQDELTFPTAKRSTATSGHEGTITLGDILKQVGAKIDKIPVGAGSGSEPQETEQKWSASATPIVQTPVSTSVGSDARGTPEESKSSAAATETPTTTEPDIKAVVTPTASNASEQKYDPEEVANMRARCATMKRFVGERGLQKDLYRFVVAHLKACPPRKDGDEEIRKLRRNAEALERFIELHGMEDDFVDYAFAGSDW